MVLGPRVQCFKPWVWGLGVLSFRVMWVFSKTFGHLLAVRMMTSAAYFRGA